MNIFCKVMQFLSSGLAAGLAIVENFTELGFVPEGSFEIIVSVAIVFNVIVMQFDKPQLVVPVPEEEA